MSIRCPTDLRRFTGRESLPTFQLTTPFGTGRDVSRERIAQALETADRSEDAEEFVAVTAEKNGANVALAPGVRFGTYQIVAPKARSTRGQDGGAPKNGARQLRTSSGIAPKSAP